jgi:hypothetical protein
MMMFSRSSGLAAVVSASLLVAVAGCGGRSSVTPTTDGTRTTQSASSSSVNTAQSIDFEFTNANSFTLAGSSTWRFDHPSARQLFSVTPSLTSVTCSGNGCGSIPQPTDPQPNLTEQEIGKAVTNNKCNFWTGSPIQPLTYTKTDTQKQTSGTGSNKLTATFTYTWTLTVTTPQSSYPARTDWIEVDSTPGGTNPVLQGWVAGMSVVKKSGTQNSPWTFHVSHTITNPDGTIRVIDPTTGTTGLSYTIYDGSTALTSGHINVTLDTTPVLDFVYGITPTALSGTGTDGLNQFPSANGNTQLLYDGAHYTSLVQLGANSTKGIVYNREGDADDFAGNNPTYDGSGNLTSNPEVQRVLFNSGPIDLSQWTSDGQPHTFKAVIAGVVKGNSGNADLTFSVSQSVIYSAENCTN